MEGLSLRLGLMTHPLGVLITLVGYPFDEVVETDGT